MKTKRIDRRALFAAVAMTASATAQADWKTYAATECVVNSANASRIEYNAFGGICNTSTTADVNIICPVVRDLAESGFPHTMRHSGRSGNSSEALTCTLRNMRTTGTTSNNGSGLTGFFHTLAPINRNNFQNNWTFVFNAVSHIPTNIGAHNYGAYAMTCKLPNSNSRIGGQNVRSCLYNYSVRED